MATVEASVAAASATLGTDLFDGLPLAQIRPGQRIVGVALKGSAAAGDSKVRFMAGSREVAEIFNNNTGFPGRDDVIPTQYMHTGGTDHVYAIVTDAPATNPLNALAIIV